MGGGLFDLSGKVAIVTGAAAGIGRAIAWQFAAAGADVAILGRRPEPLSETAEWIAAAFPSVRVLPVTADVREAEDVDGALDEVIDTFDGIDVLVNNAGGQFVSPAEQVTPKGFRADDVTPSLHTLIAGPFNATAIAWFTARHIAG